MCLLLDNLAIEKSALLASIGSGIFAVQVGIGKYSQICVPRIRWLQITLKCLYLCWLSHKFVEFMT